MRSTASTSSPDTVALARVSAAVFLLAALGNAAHLFDPLRLLRALPELCPVHLIFGIDCPGCGMGRALAHLAKGEIGAAVALHPFAPVLLVLGVGYALAPRTAVAAVERDRFFGLAVPVLCLAGVLAWWICAKLL